LLNIIAILALPPEISIYNLISQKLELNLLSSTLAAVFFVLFIELLGFALWDFQEQRRLWASAAIIAFALVVIVCGIGHLSAKGGRDE
jgi:hypothetical protein